MLRTLGRLTVDPGGFTRPKGLLLLSYLALEGPRPRGELRALFWPGDSDPAAQLRSTLLRLRRGLPGAVCAEGEVLSTTLSCDAAQVLRASDQGEDAQVIALSAGPFLDGAALPPLGGELEDWVYATRELLAGHLRRALLHQAQAAARRGDFGTAASGAARAWTLRGAPPCDPADLVSLHHLLLAGAHPAAAEVRREAQEFALPLPGDPATAQAFWRRAAAPSLPGLRALTVGRREERAQLLAWLTGPGGRGAAISGAGGMGKTHLALEVARALLGPAQAEGGQAEAGRTQAPDPVVFVSLAGVPDERAAAGRALRALHPLWQGHDDPAALVGQLGAQAALLVLDGAEDLPTFDAWLGDLLARCPHLRALVTSRLPVRVAGLHALTLGGLACTPPPPAQAGRTAAGWSDAATLLTRTARWSRDARLAPEDAAATEALAELLWGAPLALELAAAWTATLTPRELLAELRRDPTLLDRDLPGGAASPRLAFEQTWRRLGPDLRAALSGLTVFGGEVPRSAAAEVVGVTLPQLARLVDHHLLRTSAAGRFDLHPLVRAYAAEQLAAQPAWAETVRGRHTAYGLRVLTGGGGDGPEFDDAAAAWTRTLAAGDLGKLAAASAGLRGLAGRAWRQREGAALLRAALTAASGQAAHASTLAADLAWLLLQCGEGEQAVACARRSLAQATDPRARSRSGHVLASALRQTGAWAEAQACWTGILASAQALSDPPLAWRTLESLAILEEQRGNVPAAEALYMQVLAGRRRADPTPGHGAGLARTLLNYAALLLNAGQPAEARVPLRESRALLEAASDRSLWPWLLVNLAEADRQEGRVAAALTGCAAAWTAIGAGETPLRDMLLDTRARTHLAGGQPAEAAADAWQALDRAWRTGARPALLDRLTLAVQVLGGGVAGGAAAREHASALRLWLAGHPDLPHWSRREVGPAPTPAPAPAFATAGEAVVRTLHALALLRG